MEASMHRVLHGAIPSALTMLDLMAAIHDKNSSGDEIANVNFYAVHLEATWIRWNNAK